MNALTGGPRILKGAFVEYGLSIPPAMVLFQFNPVELRRQRTLDFRVDNEVSTWRTPGEPGEPGETRRVEQTRELRDLHVRFKDLNEVRENQIVSVQEEVLDFELRLDAVDALERGDPIAREFGIAPALSTLEVMTQPKEEGVLGQALGSLLGTAGFTAPPAAKPPMVLFIWGVQRVLPVNINGLTVTETEFDARLNPLRASVAVNLTVIEGGNSFFRFSRAAKEVMAALNVANLVTDIVIPG